MFKAMWKIRGHWIVKNSRMTGLTGKNTSLCSSECLVSVCIRRSSCVRVYSNAWIVMGWKWVKNTELTEEMERMGGSGWIWELIFSIYLQNKRGILSGCVKEMEGLLTTEWERTWFWLFLEMSSETFVYPASLIALW